MFLRACGALSRSTSGSVPSSFSPRPAAIICRTMAFLLKLVICGGHTPSSANLFSTHVCPMTPGCSPSTLYSTLSGCVRPKAAARWAAAASCSLVAASFSPASSSQPPSSSRSASSVVGVFAASSSSCFCLAASTMDRLAQCRFSGVVAMKYSTSSWVLASSSRHCRYWLSAPATLNDPPPPVFFAAAAASSLAVTIFTT
mmetsp:Transcript_32789/g.64981  ORF Transcript_32789/g.64981 Transcript_32789/m.64981 type:complete len:200 (-) Transcript_32789:659-1258(-)